MIANQVQRRIIHADYGHTIETVLVECGRCGRAVKKHCDHSLLDSQIARRCFPGWKVRGVMRARKTRCPKCSKEESR